MGNISASILFPSPKTACYKVLGWFSQKLRWKDFEFPDHVRRVIKTTVTIDIEKAPATALGAVYRQNWIATRQQWQSYGPILTTWPQLSHYPLKMCRDLQTTGSNGFSAHNIFEPQSAHWIRLILFLYQHGAEMVHPQYKIFPTTPTFGDLWDPLKYPCI